MHSDNSGKNRLLTVLSLSSLREKWLFLLVLENIRGEDKTISPQIALQGLYASK